MQASPLPILAPPGFRIIAHRGASGYAPENTASAFRLAFEMGATEFELDLQRSLDGEIVLCHDTDLTRFGYPGIEIEQHTWPELARLDLGAWFSPYLYPGERLIRLPDLFEAFGKRVQYHIEFKQHDPLLIPIFLQLLARSGLRENVIVTSFSLEALLAIQAQDGAPTGATDGGLRLSWLVREATPEIIAQARDHAFYQLCPRIDLVTAETVAQIKASLPEARAWGINHARREENVALARKAVETGCDGVTINWPDWIIHAA